jgi:hypothetical protein
LDAFLAPLIRGLFDPESPEWPVPRLAAYPRLLETPEHPATDWYPIVFLVDTGANTSCLHPVDSIHLMSLPVDFVAGIGAHPDAVRYGGIGGGAAFLRVPAEYRFEDIGSGMTTLRSSIEIAQLTTANRAIPSLLGWDVLQHFKVTLDWANRRIELE